jgi:hypothetical protein
MEKTNISIIFKTRKLFNTIAEIIQLYKINTFHRNNCKQPTQIA